MKYFNGIIVLFGILTISLIAYALSYQGSYFGYTPTHVVTATDTVFSESGGLLHQISVNTAVASETISVYDATSANCTGTPTGTLLATITVPSTITSADPFYIPFDSILQNGGCVKTSSTADITIQSR
jgi:hypothetical protein